MNSKALAESVTGWRPQAGKECWINWNDKEGSRERVATKYLSKSIVVFVDIYGNERAAHLDHVLRFEPIKTEAEIMRENQIKNIADFIASKFGSDIRDAVTLYEAGIRMTRELDECAIKKIVAETTKSKPESLYHYEKQAAMIAAKYVRGEIDL